MKFINTVPLTDTKPFKEEEFLQAEIFRVELFLKSLLS